MPISRILRQSVGAVYGDCREVYIKTVDFELDPEGPRVGKPEVRFMRGGTKNTPFGTGELPYIRWFVFS